MKRTVLLSVLLTFIVICGMVPTACSRGFSHQPATFNQMKFLVTPQEQPVTQTLQEALAIPDGSISYTSSAIIADINKMRLWVFSNIKQTSDDSLHGLSDYWQTPTETLALKAGDCEDFAILIVSMMRAHGVPQDQVYVAVGDDVNKNWHAFVVERYSYGAWVEFDPQTEDDAVPIDGNLALPYDISYCFNDQGGFNGKPVYAPDHSIPNASIVPVLPHNVPISISDIDSHNTNLDEAKRILGELWLPTYLPKDYFFAGGDAHSFPGFSSLYLVYRAGTGHELSVDETNVIGLVDGSMFDPGTFEQTQIDNQPAYFGIFTYKTTGSIGTSTPTLTSTVSMLVFGFVQGGLEIHFTVTPIDSLTQEELIKIAESLVEY